MTQEEIQAAIIEVLDSCRRDFDTYGLRHAVNQVFGGASDISMATIDRALQILETDGLIWRRTSVGPLHRNTLKEYVRLV